MYKRQEQGQRRVVAEAAELGHALGPDAEHFAAGDHADELLSLIHI